MPEEVILIDERDRELGSAEKLAAHRSGKLHRAVSVFVFDDSGNLLLQRRASTKYHSPNRWSNTCCGHPRPGETVSAAAHRRLREEMGFDCVLEPAFAFTYRAKLENGLLEHEFDHVFVGRFAGTPSPNPAEVGAWRWANFAETIADQIDHPDQYTVWFKLILQEHREKLASASTNRAHSS